VQSSGLKSIYHPAMTQQAQIRRQASKTPSGLVGEGTTGDLVAHLEQRTSLLKVVDVARFLALSGTQIYRLAEANTIPCIRIGGSVRFDPVVLARWLRAKQPA
jgi:excisionase family DNA binding protein